MQCRRHVKLVGSTLVGLREIDNIAQFVPKDLSKCEALILVFYDEGLLAPELQDHPLSAACNMGTYTMPW
jgi:hypothetical protein